MLIDLSYLDRSEIPPEIFNYEHITRLILRGHALTQVSPDIGRLKHLIQLDLCSYNKKTGDWHTHLDWLPDSICTLKELVQLDLCFNAVAILPYNVHRLSSLRYLNLAFNRLTDVPVSLYKLENLQFLSLRANKLSYLHPDIGKVKALAYLDIAENMIEEIPETLSECHMLSVLLLDSSFLIKLPESLNQLQSLTLLEVSCNSQLQSFPAGLNKLIHLSAVHVYNCHPNLYKSKELCSLQRVLIKKLSDFATKQCIKREPIQHNFDLLIDRKLPIGEGSDNG